ncbi:hypothetical protein [Streptomyces kronopolitis]|uniref:hypothetical protein n=1 Tax=Streptomyces kronopolitis TaxID=1612435 RepID=UPI003D969954
MPARQRKPSAPQPTLPADGLLVWSSSEHWHQQAKPCRYCGQPTNLRDSQRSPAHKVCAESALVEQQQDAAATYRTQGEL